MSLSYMGKVIYGLHGWYSQSKTGNYVVAIANHRLLNKYFPLPDYTYPPESEDTRTLSPAEFKFYKIPQMLGGRKYKQEDLQKYHDSKMSETPFLLPAAT